MIIVKIDGGLGNQMFQYATARSLADRCNVPLKLDITVLQGSDLRRYELGEFNIRAEIASRDDLSLFSINHNQCSFWSRLKKHIPLLTPKKVFRESSFLFDERYHTITPPVYLDGYWQSERYFINDCSLIRRDFTLREPLDTNNIELLKNVKTKNAVSVHVRRGDYISSPKTFKVHGVCSLEYYHAAVKYIAERVEQPHIFVFSDDYRWTKNNLDFGCPTTFININSDGRGVCDMMLMASCKHHIIANSSFSWWGAWLNSSSGKIVIAPKLWFKKTSYDTRDLVPETWIRL